MLGVLCFINTVSSFFSLSILRHASSERYISTEYNTGALFRAGHVSVDLETKCHIYGCLNNEHVKHLNNLIRSSFCLMGRTKQY